MKIALVLCCGIIFYHVLFLFLRKKIIFRQSIYFTVLSFVYILFSGIFFLLHKKIYMNFFYNFNFINLIFVYFFIIFIYQFLAIFVAIRFLPQLIKEDKINLGNWQIAGNSFILHFSRSIFYCFFIFVQLQVEFYDFDGIVLLLLMLFLCMETIMIHSIMTCTNKVTFICTNIKFILYIIFLLSTRDFYSFVGLVAITTIYEKYAFMPNLNAVGKDSKITNSFH